MEGGEEETEEGGDMLDAKSGVSGADFDKAYTAAPARLNTRRRPLRHVAPVSASKPRKTTTNIPFSPKYVDYIVETWYEIIKKIFSRLINFVF